MLNNILLYISYNRNLQININNKVKVTQIIGYNI